MDIGQPGRDVAGKEIKTPDELASTLGYAQVPVTTAGR
jgi:hypothetical protein